MGDKIYTLYKTKNCARCPLAAKSMSRANKKYEEVFLDDPNNSEILEGVKDDMHSDILSVPIIKTPTGRYLTNLADISEYFRGDYVTG